MSWPKKRRRWVVGIVIAFILYSLVGFLLVPRVVKWQLAKRLSSFCRRQTVVRQVRMNPWTLSLTVRGVALTEPDGRLFASWEEFYANLQLSSLFRWAWTFKEIHLNDAFGEVILGKDGQFNFANIFHRTNATPPRLAGETTLPRLLIFDLSVTNGHVVFADLTRKTPFRADHQPINFRLKNFTTKAARQSPYSFEAASDTGRSLSWAGAITAQPAASEGTLRITGVRLPKFAPYLEEFFRAQLADGEMDVASNYHFALATNGMDLVISNLVVTIAKLQVNDPDTHETVLAVPSCELRDGGLDWRGKRARVGSLIITEPASLVRRRADGSINLRSLVMQRAPSSPHQTNAPAVEPWRIVLDDYRLERGAVEIEDATVPGPFRTLLKPLSVHLEHFTTAPGSNAVLEAAITTEMAESVHLAAACSFNPLRAEGTLKVSAIDLRKYRPYLRPFFRGDLSAGKADVALEFLHQRKSGADAATLSNVVIRVSGLAVKPPAAAETVLSVRDFAVERGSASLLDRAAHVGLVRTTGGSILARRDADGSLNLQALLPTNASPATASPGLPTKKFAAPPWNVRLDEVAIENYAVNFEDKVPPKSAVVKLDQLAVRVKGFRTGTNAPLSTALSVRVNQGGLVTLRGTTWLTPPAADLEVGVTNLDLRALQPYAEPRARLGISSGAFATHGRAVWQRTGTNAPGLRFTGGFSVTNLLTVDQAFEEFVKWNALDVDGIDFAQQPERLQVNAVRLDGLKASLLIGPDKQPNFTAILRKTTNAPPMVATSRPGSAAKKSLLSFPVDVATVSFRNAVFRFADASIQPPCQFGIQELSGTIKGLSSDATAAADVDLAGRVDEQSPFGVSGTVNPLAPELTVSLTLSNRNLQLTTFTPYMEKYGGHPINKGRLSLNLHYDIRGRELKAQNQFQIEQLMLGPRNESPDATQLPVKLAVALLKDRNGRIELDVPVTGRLDDPKFRVGPIILNVVVNLIAKVATSPFKLLGALVGGGEELSFIDFEPGKSGWLEGETNKLVKLVRALEERPAVNLEIEASVDPQLDREALARKFVRASIKTQRLQELAAVGQHPAAPESFQVEAEQLERLLRAAVVKQFGTNLSDAIGTLTAEKLTNAPPARAAPETRKKPGVFGRLTGWLPLHRKDSPAGAARQQAKADAALLKQNPELASMPAEVMEILLASRTEVPADAFLRLMQERALAVQKELMKSGQVTADRLFLMSPKPVGTNFQGQARVNLSLN